MHHLEEHILIRLAGIDRKLDLLIALADGSHDTARIAALTRALKSSEESLKSAVLAADPTVTGFTSGHHTTTTGGSTMPADLTGLTQQVKANTDAEASAVILINGLAVALVAAKNDPVAPLWAAVVANTPTPPTP